MLALLLATFAVAFAAPRLTRAAGARAGLLLAALPGALFAWALAQVPAVAAGGVLAESVAWVPSLGVDLAFRLDGLALLFVLLVTGLGALVVAYAGTYLKGDPRLGRFFLALIAFMGAMLGLVLADDLITLFVFWELTSLTSFLLIGFDHHRAESRRAALQALLVTGLGGLALLAGLLLLGHAGGSSSLAALTASAADIQAHPLAVPALLLLLAGAFTKSAQVPFHFWLPDAMAAPTPVSAYLHSATMVKAGIYLLMRLDPILGALPLWTASLTLAGGATMLLGAVLAVRQHDLKKILAYSTLTALGTLTLLLGLSFGPSVKAAVVFLVVHSLYKGGLFLAAGAIDHEAGTRDVRQLGGLWRAMPFTAAGAALAGLSMAGLPPLFGFIGKELTYKAKLGFEGADWLLPAAAVAANALTVVAAALVAWRPFAGRPVPTPRAAHEAPPTLWLGPVVLGGACIALGLFPSLVEASLVAPAVAAILGAPWPVDLSLWYGLNAALLLSALTAALGLAGWLLLPRLQRLLDAARVLDLVDARAVAARLGAATLALARRHTALVERGPLRTWLMVIVACAFALLGAGLAVHHAPPPPALPGGATPFEWAIGALTAVSALVAAAARTRLLALVALGLVGTGLAILFLLAGAPDVAVTQLVVDTLFVVIALAVLRHLGALAGPPRPAARPSLTAAGLAAVAGVVTAAVTLAVLAVPLDPSVSSALAAESVPAAHGRNVVNVILVDFRALDTLGEITVLATAALGAAALLRAARRAPGHAGGAP